MRFDKITISNFRQYRHIDFAFPKTTGCDMHIIEASNGVGKTNMLNAVNWCLYGDEPHLSGGGDLSAPSESLPVYNISAMEEAKATGDNTCPVSVCIEGSNEEGQFAFKRTVHFNVTTHQQTGVDEFEIQKFPFTGDMEIFSGKEADTVVDQYMPKKIREYFYFDGERLLNYLTNTESKTSKIRDSIYQIAGVNFINRASEHLSEYTKTYQKKVLELSPDLEIKTKALNDANEAVKSKEEEIAELSQQIAHAESAIAQADGILEGTEESREANIKYKENQQAIDEASDQLKDVKSDLVQFVKKYFAKLMLYSVNKETFDYITDREDQAAFHSEVNLNLIKDSLEKHECQLCKQEIPHDVEEELKKLVSSYEANASMQTLIAIKSDIRRALNLDDYLSDKKKIFDRMRNLTDKITELKEQNDKLWEKIEIVGDMNGLEKATASKKENEELLQLNIEKRGSYKTMLENLKKAQAKAQSEYNQAIENDKKCGEFRNKYAIVDRAHGIVEGVKSEIIEDIKTQMQDETKRIFDKLMWKKDTYGKVELDENFRLQVFHKRTGQSCLYSCSAAEKELLALSFTIALQNISGYDNMLFIDTPVGRVSDINRENFAKVLLEVSQGKQIILAFTPSEYSDEISNVLSQDVISSYNKLSYNDDVTVKEG